MGGGLSIDDSRFRLLVMKVFARGTTAQAPHTQASKILRYSAPQTREAGGRRRSATGGFRSTSEFVR